MNDSKKQTCPFKDSYQFSRDYKNKGTYSIKYLKSWSFWCFFDKAICSWCCKKLAYFNSQPEYPPDNLTLSVPRWQIPLGQHERDIHKWDFIFRKRGFAIKVPHINNEKNRWRRYRHLKHSELWCLKTTRKRGHSKHAGDLFGIEIYMLKSEPGRRK